MRSLALGLLLLGLGCAARHPHRIGARQVQQLAKKGDPFLLVFGSVQAREGDHDVTAQRHGAGTAIRFLWKEPPGAVGQVLREVAIRNRDRFYAVLAAPAPLRRADHFEAQVRWFDPAYDAILYLKLPQSDAPMAVYMGEVELTVAGAEERRTAPRRILSVRVRDDFPAARRELAKLYPRFRGEVVSRAQSAVIR